MTAIGPLQLRIMQEIWKLGPTDVHAVHQALNIQGTKKLAYTTILTVMRNLVKRAFLDQQREGRKHRFIPLIDQGTYALAMVRNLRLELFGGNVLRLLGCIADDDGIDPLKRRRIRELALE